MDIEVAKALGLLVAANASPVVVAKLAGERWAWPLDFGYELPDGDRLFGAHKTWRGLVSGVVAGTVAAGSMGLSWWLGAGFATASLLGDAVSSAIKRRMKLRPGTEHLGLDQFGEVLLPLALCSRSLSLDLLELTAVAVAFTVLDVCAAGLRHRPWLR